MPQTLRQVQPYLPMALYPFAKHDGESLSMTDEYERIAQAIRFIRDHKERQPALSEIAEQVGLSEYHFQRLFSRWAGISPKRYLQALTLEHAKMLLEKTRISALEASYEVGLSSGSRLYDHFVQIEAVTPSEFKLRGKGLKILYAYHPTPFGLVFLAKTTRGICQMDFVDENNRQAALNALKAKWCNAEIIEDKIETGKVIASLFSREHANPTPLSLWVSGTNFQLSVWKALLKINMGEVVSYKDIAQYIGKPKASRAVGTAIGSNPVALIIPCHRVLKQNGQLGGYRWGEVRKHALLAWECAYSSP